ncbi:MAG: hypothetical protein WC603_02620 [Candidatus Paceibacterota bacterium]
MAKKKSWQKDIVFFFLKFVYIIFFTQLGWFLLGLTASVIFFVVLPYEKRVEILLLTFLVVIIFGPFIPFLFVGSDD